ncbi:D-serine deaminase, pyridoxal phosphate-dependent [Burkholderia sp. D7]|nr:D-serine deaminase, pyridoxal phosphate-dependent [Burkholderia sp. D7]
MILDQIETPAALIDRTRMQRNIARMQSRMDTLGVAFRPHVKTSKCVQVAQAQRDAGARGITVSTLKEAEQFFVAGFSDILYAVGMVASKLPRALALRRAGCDLKLVVDNLEAALAVAEFGRDHRETFEVWIEIDTDGHRSGVQPDEARLIDIGRALHGDDTHHGARLGGVMTHAGSSYDLNTPDALATLAEQERAGCVHAAERLRDAGLPCDVVSVGSTPTALAAQHLEGVTEVRAGVYVFFDLVMCNVGVCTTADLALSVLTTVIGHQVDKGWAILDAGWMAMSRDRGTSKQTHDYGYGQPCTLDGAPLDGYVLMGANQEHGILANVDHPDRDIAGHLPVGTRLLILPNHACATGAQFPAYHARSNDGEVAVWDRFYGW